VHINLYSKYEKQLNNIVLGWIKSYFLLKYKLLLECVQALLMLPEGNKIKLKGVSLKEKNKKKEL